MAGPRPSHLPSDRHLAFALVVVRFRPASLTFSELFKSLKQHIARGRRRDALSSTYRHLDSASYWRDRCKQQEAELKAVKSVNVDQRQEIEGLRQEIESTRGSKASNAAKAKRKRQDAAEASERAAKRSRHDPIEDFEAEWRDADDAGKSLLRCLYDVHLLLTEPPTDEDNHANELIGPLIEAATLVAEVVLEQVATVSRESTPTTPDLQWQRLQSTLAVASRAVHTVLLAYDKLSRVLTPVNDLGRVVHDIVVMFKSLLGGFDRLSLGRAMEAPTASSSTIGKGKASTAKSHIVKTDPALAVYAQFLSGIVENIKTTEPNKSIFEGITFCVLKHCSERLNVSVFGQTRSADIEKEILLSNPNDDIEDEDTYQENEARKRQVRIEAPYLTHLLSHVMAAAPAHLGRLAVSRLAKAKQGTKHALAVSAKECLQRTLINCVFGEEGDDSFRECLRMPVPKGEVTLPRVKEEDVRPWLHNEMFRLIGWEILEQEDLSGVLRNEMPDV